MNQEHAASLKSRLGSSLAWLGPVLGLLAVYTFFAILIPESFATVRTLETIARQTAIVGTAALGATMVIIAGGIDLSVGSIVALSTVVIALLLDAGVDPLLAASAGICAGAVVGITTGLLITRLRVAPFIITLGMLLLIRGVAKGLAKEQKVDAPLTWLSELLATLPANQRWMFVPSGVWLVIAMALITTGILRYTPFGRHLFAIGSNEKTAMLCGVNVPRVKMLVYALSAGLAGMAGVMQFSRLTVGDPTVAVGLELNVIAAVVIGGGSLSGGEGNVLGTLVGALIMTVINAGCSHLGLPNWVQEIVTGSIIVIAVTVDRWRHRRSIYVE